MSEQFLRSGDKAIYNPQFGMATVSVRPGTLTGTGQYNVMRAAICVRGDESSAEVPGCSYTAGPYSIPGTGTLSIFKLNADQLSQKTKSGGKPVMLKGTQFEARFTVTSPAKTPPDKSIPDPTPHYSGTGTFQTTNDTVTDKG